MKPKFELWCDKGILFSLCVLILFLPVSIALVDSFAALAIFLYLLKKISQGKGLYPQRKILNRPIEILLIVVFISVLQSQFFTLSLFAFVGKFAKGIFLYFSFVEVFINEKRLRLFLFVFLTAGFLVALSGVIQLYTGVDFLRGRPFIGYRINASFTQPNTLGAFLIIPLGIVCHLLYAAAGKGKLPLWQLTLAVLLSVLLISLCWTYSRASWVGYLFSLLLMVVMDRRKLLYASVLCIIILYAFLPNLNALRHVSLFKDTLPTVNALEHKHNFLDFLKEGGSGRLTFWNNAFFIIQKYPVWGSGLNTYTRDLQRFSLPYWYAHNCYLQMAAETGLIGLLCFLWMLFVLFRSSLDSLKLNPGEAWSKSLLQGLVAGLGGLLINSFLDNSLYTVQLGILFWVMIGFTVALIGLNSRHGTFAQTPLSKKVEGG